MARNREKRYDLAADGQTDDNIHGGKNMILADKIVNLRKKNGWSQEELAERTGVSRQAVSKWESAQSVPDLEKILTLSRLFGVTTDYLLKDELEDEEFTNEADSVPVRKISLAMANEFLTWRAQAGRRIALGAFLCIVAAIPMLLLVAATEMPGAPVSEGVAAGGGMIALLLLVAGAVALFVSCGFKNAPYEFIDKEPFETEYGVDGMVRERQNAFRAEYVKCNIAGACLCVLSPIPLFMGLFVEENAVLVVGMLTITMLVAAVGVWLFIVSGVRWESMRKLLREGDYAPENRDRVRLRENVGTVYWLIATAIYLAWSFLTNAWEITWVVWPVAGVLFAVAMCACNVIAERRAK